MNFIPLFRWIILLGGWMFPVQASGYPTPDYSGKRVLNPLQLIPPLNSAQPPRETGSFKSSDLVEVIRMDSSFTLDVRYATEHNFIGKKVYDEARFFLQRPAAEALLRVNQSLHQRGYGLVLFDGYRPWSVTKIFWDFMPPDKKQFVADPSLGSVHSRGCAVDLTLKDLKTNQPVSMPSDFDEWSDRAYLDYKGGSVESRRNREILREAMEKEGFLPCNLEWWHFTYKDWESYRVENVRFSEIPLK